MPLSRVGATARPYRDGLNAFCKRRLSRPAADANIANNYSYGRFSDTRFSPSREWTHD